MTRLTRLRELALDAAYSTGTSDLLAAFYLPCLSVSVGYDRAVGFFRSSLFVVAGLAFSDFAQRGGRARLVCSPSFTREDLEGIQRGIAWRELADGRFAADLATVLASPDGVPVAQFLATLIASERLEIRVAVRPASSGIFHDKLGVFSDVVEDAVTFVGSVNETLAAWDPRVNHEGFEVFKSWSGGDEAQRVARHRAFFENLWLGRHPGVTTLQIPEAARTRLLEIRDRDGLDSSAWTVRRALGAEEAPRLRKESTAGALRPPRKVLQDHQRTVVESWERAGKRGIIAHVTGAGKTVSALEVIRRWILSGQPALVLVPSELLLRQWQLEIAEAFAGTEVETLTAGGGASRASWEASLADFTRPLRELGPRIVLSTIQTAARDPFIRKVQQGSHLLLVADEVHRLGAPSYRRLLRLQVGGSLGLSATPRRFGDPEGTAAIYRAFGSELEPQIDIGAAIRIGRLVPYDYFVHRVTLTRQESEEWDALSEEVARVFATLPRGDGGERQSTPRYEQLLFRRARVIKQAAGKIPLALDVIAREMRSGDRWLVYCDDTEQLSAVASGLRGAGAAVFEYHSAMEGSREATLSAFTTHGGVLVAIKCLDEGVDLPTVNKALILASSTNPREFIQRRGRVLRKAPDKLSAAIHDAIVLPDPARLGAHNELPSFALTDLSRAMEFAKHARNTAVVTELRLWAAELGLVSADLEAEAFEEEEPVDA